MVVIFVGKDSSTTHIGLPPLLVACKAHTPVKMMLVEIFACDGQKISRARGGGM
jgi:methionyl-tRNA synthetase